MNNELVELFLTAVADQLKHGYNHFKEVEAKHGQEAAKQHLDEAMDVSIVIARMDHEGIRHSTLAEDMIEASWSYLCILLDLELCGATVIDGPDGHRVITIPEQAEE